MSTIPISQPAIPFVGFMPGGLSIGRKLRITGQMTHAGDRFAIYVQSGPSIWPRDNCSLHLSVRPNEMAIVRNHFANQQWANEERHGGCPIQRGGYYDILISAEPTFFTISINGAHFCTFNYRLPVFGNSQYIAIEGDTTVTYIGQESESGQPPHMLPTPYIPTPYVTPPAIGIHPPLRPPFIPLPRHHGPGPHHTPHPPHHHHPHHHHHTPPGPPRQPYSPRR